MTEETKAVELQSVENLQEEAGQLTAEVDAIKEEIQSAVGVPESIRHLSPEELEALEKKLVRRIDIRLMPMIIFIYFLNYLDRNNIATAKLGGILTDLNLTSAQFQTAVSILFVGYVLMQVPSNLILDKIGRPSLYLTTCMLIWGIISTSVAATQSFGTLVATRFLLGFIEAAYFPGCLFYLSSWYTRKELTVRTSALCCGTLIAGAVAGLLSAAIVQGLDYAHGLRAWRWTFIIYGSITIGTVPFAYFILPDFPATTKWLSTEERDLAIWRLRREVGVDDWTSSEAQSFKEGLSLAVKDIKVWVLAGCSTFTIAASSMTNFFPSVVQTLGYNSTITLLLTTPPYILGIIVTIFVGWHADKVQERYWHVTIPAWIGIIAFIISVATLNTGARYFAMMLMIPSIYSGYTVSLPWVSNVIARPPIKRAVALAMINVMCTSTNIWTAYMYYAAGAPRYVVAMIMNAVFLVLTVTFCTILKIMLGRLNKRIERGELDLTKEFGSAAANSKHATQETFRYLT